MPAGQQIIRIRQVEDAWDHRARSGALVSRSGRELEDVSAPTLDYSRGRNSYVPGTRNAVTPRVYLNEKPPAAEAVVERRTAMPSRPLVVEKIPAGKRSCGAIVGQNDVFYMPCDLIRAVCQICGVTRTKLVSRSQTADIAKARQICFWAMKRFTNRSLPSIGQMFGRDHTTTLHGVRRATFAIAELGLVIPDDPIEAIRVLHQANWPRLQKRPLIVRREVLP